ADARRRRPNVLDMAWAPPGSCGRPGWGGLGVGERVVVADGGGTCVGLPAKGRATMVVAFLRGCQCYGTGVGEDTMTPNETVTSPRDRLRPLLRVRQVRDY